MACHVISERFAEHLTAGSAAPTRQTIRSLEPFVWNGHRRFHTNSRTASAPMFFKSVPAVSNWNIGATPWPGPSHDDPPTVAIPHLSIAQMVPSAAALTLAVDHQGRPGSPQATPAAYGFGRSLWTPVGDGWQRDRVTARKHRLRRRLAWRERRRGAAGIGRRWRRGSGPGARRQWL